MAKNTYLPSKPRYEILDGLRGIAAVLVVVYHLFETYYHGGCSQPVNHGYLAVDFFFVLSGFVIGYAYDDRWNKMSTWQFFKRRLVLFICRCHGCAAMPMHLWRSISLWQRASSCLPLRWHTVLSGYTTPLYANGCGRSR